MKYIFLVYILIDLSFGQSYISYGGAPRYNDGTRDINVKSATFNDSLLFTGNGKYWRNKPIELHVGRVAGIGVPTRIDNINGGHAMGYSMPIAGADEILYYKGKSSRCWDGTTNFQIRFLVCLAAAETAGETFKFDLSWQTQDVGIVVPSSPTATYSDSVTVIAGREAIYNIYFLYFDVAPDGLLPNQMMSGKLDRVDSSGDQVDGEVIVLHWISCWLCDKIGTTSDW